MAKYWNINLTILITLLIYNHFVKAHFRGPHHPKGNPVKIEESHHHYVPQRYSTSDHDSHSSVLTHDKNLLHDKEHLKEDMGEWLFENGRHPTDDEMEFHYFKTHDFDNNSKLDGLEILQALSHVLPPPEIESPHQSQQQQIHNARRREEDFNYYIGLIDQVLEEDDVDGDGYLSYAEYVLGRRRGDEEVDAKLKKHATKLSTSGKI